MTELPPHLRLVLNLFPDGEVMVGVPTYPGGQLIEPADGESCYSTATDRPEAAKGTNRLAAAVGRKLYSAGSVKDAVKEEYARLADPRYEAKQTALRKLTRPGFLNNSFTPEERAAVIAALKGTEQ